MIGPLGVEAAGTPLDTVDLVPFGEQQFGQIGTILPGHAGNEGSFGRVRWGDYQIATSLELKNRPCEFRAQPLSVVPVLRRSIFPE
jgi:hypothetical protein